MCKDKLLVQPSGVLEQAECESTDGSLLNPAKPSVERRKFEYVWRSIISLAILHVAALYGAWLIFSGQTMLKTIIFS